MPASSPRVTRLLSDHLTGTSVREIDALFDDRGVELGPPQPRGVARVDLPNYGGRVVNGDVLTWEPDAARLQCPDPVQIALASTLLLAQVPRLAVLT